MKSPERIIFVPDGDTQNSHPQGICQKALDLRDEILWEEDILNDRTPMGVCIRRKGIISGCLVKIVPLGLKKHLF